MTDRAAPTKDDIETARLVVELNDSMDVATPDFVRRIADADPPTPPRPRTLINGWPSADAKDVPIIASTQLAEQIEAEPGDEPGNPPASLRPVLMTEDIYQMVLREELRYLTDADGDTERVRVVGRPPKRTSSD